MKKSNKWTAAAVVMTLLVGTAPMMTASAETTQQAGTLSQEQAIAAAKKHINIPKAYKLESARLSEGEKAIWDFSWMSEEFAKRNNLHVQIDAITGELLAYHNWDYSGQPTDSIKVTKQQAQATAEAWIKKHQPTKFKNVQYIEQINLNESAPGRTPDKTYSFQYTRLVNGIPFPGDGFSVVIGEQGDVAEFNYTWTLEDHEFPKTDGVLNQAKANAAFVKNLPMELHYQIEYNNANKAVTHLFHTPVVTYDRYYGYTMNLLLDANTGDLITRTGGQPEAKQPLTPIADKPGAAPVEGGQVSKEQALKQAEQYLGHYQGLKLQDSEYLTYRDDSKAWRLIYVPANKTDYPNLMQVEVMIDAVKGELIRFYGYNDRGPEPIPENPQLSYDQAKTKALDYLKKALPTQLDSLVLTSTEKSTVEGRFSMGYTFEFKKVINGLPLEGGTVNVSVQPDSGSIVSFDNNLPMNTALTFPQPDTAMSVETAKTKYLERFPLHLQYIRLVKEDSQSNPYKGGTPEYGEARLVYAPLGMDPEWGKLEANTGEWYGPWGSKLWVKKSVNDIAGHWAENELQSLANREILALDKDGNLNPNQVITRGEAVKVLVMSRVPYYSGEMDKTDNGGHYQDVDKNDPYYQFIERAVLMNWFPKDLKNFRPDAPLTREELAEVAVKVMNYGELAKKDGVFIKPFADLTAEEDRYLGSIAIMKAFGIMKGDGTNFSPNQNVSKAELAVVVERIRKELEKNGPTYY